MGGSILFTESTEFDPKVYGLVPGKFINYIIIGGGGAGGSCGRWKYRTTTNDSYSNREGAFDSGGSNGQTSSIGNYVTVSGGINGDGYIRPKWYDNDGDTRYYNYIDGGQGAVGWIPGKIFNYYSKGAYPSGAERNGNLAYRFNEYIDGNYKILVDTHGESTAMTSYPVPTSSNILDPSISQYEQGHKMLGIPNPYKKNQIHGVLSQGNDGSGYGAGGGGHAEYRHSDTRNEYGGQGGNSGEFKMGSFKLDSIETIPITIGEGGSPHTTFSTLIDTNYPVIENTSSYLGMTGTSGAVMLFWD